MAKISPLRLALCLALPVLGQAAMAQAPNPALDEAKRRLACGAGTPVAAEYLPNGTIKVTCRSNAAETAAQALPEALQATGLAGSPALPAVITIILLAAVAGDGDDGSATTTTSTGSDQ